MTSREVRACRSCSDKVNRVKKRVIIVARSCADALENMSEAFFDFGVCSVLTAVTADHPPSREDVEFQYSPGPALLGPDHSVLAFPSCVGEEHRVSADIRQRPATAQ